MAYTWQGPITVTVDWKSPIITTSTAATVEVDVMPFLGEADWGGPFDMYVYRPLPLCNDGKHAQLCRFRHASTQFGAAKPTQSKRFFFFQSIGPLFCFCCFLETLGQQVPESSQEPRRRVCAVLAVVRQPARRRPVRAWRILLLPVSVNREEGNPKTFM